MKVRLFTAAFAAVLMVLSALAQQPAAVTSPKAPLSADETAAVLAYWTPERIASAKPMDLLVADQTSPGQPQAPIAPGPAVFGEGALPTLNLAFATGTEAAIPFLGANQLADPLDFTYTYPFNTYADPDNLKFPLVTVGTLFFTLQGSNYRCSASVIRPHLLLTARHCVYDYSNHVWATNVVFNPAWNAGKPSLKYGTWVARTLATWTSGAPGYNYDLGFIQLADRAGYGCNGSSGTLPIEAYTGFLGWTYGGGYSQRQWTILGFPAVKAADNAPFDGKFLIRTDAATGHINDDLGGDFTNTVEVGSNQTGGTSGGPWIIGHNPAPVAKRKYSGNNLLGSPNGNYANGVNSFKFTVPNHALAINGPEFFDYNFYNLMTFAQGLPCP